MVDDDENQDVPPKEGTISKGKACLPIKSLPLLHPPKLNIAPWKMMVGRWSGFLLGWAVGTSREAKGADFDPFYPLQPRAVFTYLVLSDEEQMG